MSFDTNFYEVRSNSAVDGVNFKGTINMDFLTPYEKRIDLSECYASISYEITHYDNSSTPDVLRATTDANGKQYIPYLNPNYPLLCFNSIYCQINGKQISELIDPATAVTMYESCFLSRSELDTKDGMTLNRQLRKSENSSIINTIKGLTVAVGAGVIVISAISTVASYPFSVTVGDYTFTGTLSATFTASQVDGDVNTKPFTITAINDVTKKVYLFTHPAIANGATIDEDTSVTFKAITNIMTLAQSVDYQSADKRIQYALAQQGEFGKSRYNTITFRIPTALFMSKGYIGQNAQISLRWVVNNNYGNEMIGCYNAKPIIYNATATTTQNSILVKVRDFKLYMRAETMPNLVSLYKVPLIQMSTMYRSITSVGLNSFNFSMPPQHVTYIIISFLQQNRGSTGKYSSTDFSSSFSDASPEVKVSTDATSKVSNVRVMWGGVVKPQPDYTLDMSAGDTNENGRAWSDFVSLIEARADRSASAYDYDMWVNAPLFIYKFGKNITGDNNINVSVNMASGYSSSSSQLFVTALYNEDLILNYGSDGKVTDLALTYE